MKLPNYLQITILGCFIFFLNISNSNAITKFIAEKTCPIYKFSTEIKDSDKKVGHLDLKKNYNFQTYKNFRNKEYILINEDINANESLLVNKNCGYNIFESEKKFESIFDSEEINFLDRATKFDQEILKLCGPFGSHPKKEEFIALVSQKEYFNILYKNLNQFIITPNAEKTIFIEELTDLFFKNNGFQHIFCGIRKNKKLAGPHYYYRFLELQKNNQIGKNSSSKCETRFPHLYITNHSIDFLDQKGELHSKCNNSFIKNLNALEIISISALISRINNNDTEGNTASCLYQKEINDQNILFKLVYDKKNRSVITFYPIEKDKCLDNSKDKKECFCKITL